MSKGLEAFEKIKKWHEIYEVEDIALYGSPEYATSEYEQEEELNAVEKELKALEIIKKNVFIHVEDNVLTITTGRKAETIKKIISAKDESVLKEVLL